MVQNPGTHKIICPDIENPSRAHIEARIAELLGLGWYAPEEVSSLVSIATDTRGVPTGQVHYLGHSLRAAINA
jgi:hypothetical protein